MVDGLTFSTAGSLRPEWVIGARLCVDKPSLFTPAGRHNDSA
jgi:hypothetical protein